jgi:hypothetical protein
MSQSSPPERRGAGASHLLALSIQYILPWAGAILCLWLLREILADQSQDGSWGAAVFDMLSGLRRIRGFALVLGLVGIVYGARQRNLRRRSERVLKERIAELEHRLGERRLPGDEAQS